MALVPSIVVSEFFTTLSGVRSREHSVSARTVPRGSERVGVAATVNNKSLMVVVNTRNFKVVDVEWQRISLVNMKKFAYQRDLRQYWGQDPANSRPVTQLTEQLIQSGKLIRCD
ncbi:MAG: hypothetical protein AB7G93_16185 [Bdellovibrionales bacterium]